MTKPIVSFGAIVAIFTLPLAAYAQPIGGTAAPGAPTRPAAAHLVRLRARRFRQRRQAPAELDHVAIAVLPVIQELEVREDILERHGSCSSSATGDTTSAARPLLQSRYRCKRRGRDHNLAPVAQQTRSTISAHWAAVLAWTNFSAHALASW
jgi:hypothetical protein